VAVTTTKFRWRQKPPPGGKLDVTHPLAAGLAGCWMLNEGSGPTLVDLTRRGVDASLVGGPTWSSGRDGFALTYSGGSGQYATVSAGAAAAALQPAGQVSVEAWGQLAVAPVGGTYYILVCQYSTGYLLTAIGGTLYFYAGSGSASGGTLTAGGWHQVVGTYDGATVRIYLDGAPVGSAAATGAIAYSGLPFRIGSDSNGLSNWNGGIGPVRVWSRALGASEVAALYAEPYALVLPPGPRRWAPPPTSAGLAAAAGAAAAGLGATASLVATLGAAAGAAGPGLGATATLLVSLGAAAGAAGPVLAGTTRGGLPVDLMEALVAALDGSASLANAFGHPDWLWDEAPRRTAYPYATLAEVRETAAYQAVAADGSTPYDDRAVYRLTIHATDQDQARDLAFQVQTALTDAPLSFTRGSLLQLRRADRWTTWEPGRGPNNGDVWQRGLSFEAVTARTI